MTKKIKYPGNNKPYTNDNYWGKRVANHVWNSYNTLEEENYALIKYYDKLSDDVRLQLFKLAEQAKSGDLTRSEKYLKNHLEELQKQITKQCEILGEKVENKAISNISKELQSNYQNVTEKLSASNFHQLSKNQCKEIINNPWHGSFFSKRIWKDTGKLANDLNDILSVGITQGKTIAEMAVQMSNRVNQSMNHIHRLVRTETINSLNRSSLRGLKDAGVEFVRWWAAEDERTCELCGANHGKVYPIDKAPNLPCHPGCRCTWLPVFEDELSIDDIVFLSPENEIIIDKFTPCLEKRSNGKIYQTVTTKLKKNISTQTANKMKENGWKFDWSLPQKMGADIYALSLEGDDKIQGLISSRPDFKSHYIYVPIVESAPHNVGHNGEFDGVGAHLFAIVCQESFELGFEGYVSFKAKTILKDHYVKELKAKELGNGNLYIDTENAKILVDKYLKKGGK